MNKKKLKIGLLPLYLKLYDDRLPGNRAFFENFTTMICDELRSKNIEVSAAPICRIKNEFAMAVDNFETEKVDAIVTLHLAYSPSLESATVLAGTKLPLIILDTTPEYSFTPAKGTVPILENHGIHGVQDMCNLLLRNGKPFQIHAGHWQHSDVIDRVIHSVKAAKIANSMRNSRIGLIGQPFQGMGDFLVPYDKLKATVGVEVVHASLDDVGCFIAATTADELANEVANDRKNYSLNGINDDLLRDCNRDGLAIRKWLEAEDLSGFSVNFDTITNQTALSRVPFMEACKTLQRGLGYAGEGDVLTAALVAALLDLYPETSFIETFCPGWEHDNLLISHMGEMNLALTADKPELIAYESSFVNQPTIKGCGCFKPGKALFINLAPTSDDTFKLIIAPITVEAVGEDDMMDDTVRGWIKPQIPLNDFLEKYSLAGGTHHQAMVYDADIDIIVKFAQMMQWEIVVL